MSPQSGPVKIWNPSEAVPLQLCQMDPNGLFLLLLLMATRNPENSPVEVGGLSHYSQGFIHPGWLVGISEPSTVSQDKGREGLGFYPPITNSAPLYY